jgi:hypothetical protein
VNCRSSGTINSREIRECFRQGSLHPAIGIRIARAARDIEAIEVQFVSMPIVGIVFPNPTNQIGILRQLIEGPTDSLMKNTRKFT